MSNLNTDNVKYTRAEQAEQLKRRHIEAEGRHAWNDNPDGCYYCGSPHHHSSDCQDPESQV
jgi:hypothetical protein